MNTSKLSRREAMKIGGGALAISGLASQTSAKARTTEIEQVRAMIGQHFSVDDGETTSRFELEEVVAFGQRVRQPLSMPGREPFVVVFRQLSADDIKDGLLHFTTSGGATFDIMVTPSVPQDGDARFEATFN